MERVYLEEVDSTNKWAKEHLSELGGMSVVYTYKQMAGRGRLERKWNYNGDGNIYASIVIKHRGSMKESYSNLTQYLSLVISEVFEEYGVQPVIKWPNDIKVEGKKITGILAEAVTDEIETNIILGFGVNLNCSKEDMEKIDKPATALNLVTGMEIDKEQFFRRVLDKFCLGYDKFIGEGFQSIRKEYKKRAEFLNREVTVQVFDKFVSGIAKDVTKNGALKIVDNNGIEQVLYMGDIL